MAIYGAKINTAPVIEENYDFENHEISESCDIMEAVIGILENDKNMFDSLLELDFISVQNEHTLLESEAAALNEAADESKISKIGQKIKELWDFVIGKIKDAIANAMKKIKEIFDFDGKMISSYSEVIKKANYSTYPGIPNFSLPNTNKIITQDILNNYLFNKDITKAYQDISSAADRDTVDNILAKYKEDKRSKDDIYEEMHKSAFYPKMDEWKPKAKTDYDEIINGVKNAKSIHANLKDAGNRCLAAAKAKKNSIKEDRKAAKGQELEVYKMTAQYKLASKEAQDITMVINCAIKIAAEQAKAYRKALLSIGHFATKQLKGGSLDEATMFILGESSDEYVNECMAF